MEEDHRLPGTRYFYVTGYYASTHGAGVTISDFAFQFWCRDGPPTAAMLEQGALRCIDAAPPFAVKAIRVVEIDLTTYDAFQVQLASKHKLKDADTSIVLTWHLIDKTIAN